MVSKTITKQTSSSKDDFIIALDEHALQYGVELSAQDRAVLGDYHEIINRWNARLHLVAPCSPAEFATRHVLESLLLLPHLPRGARVADVGSGAGLPILPCVIVRPDIEAVLIEASSKKAIFLREAIDLLELGNRARVVAERFEKTSAPQVEFVTCRALERFQEMLPRLVAWSPAPCTLLLFGGHALRERIEQLNLRLATVPIPNSEQRFLFIVERTV